MMMPKPMFSAVILGSLKKALSAPDEVSISAVDILERKYKEEVMHANGNIARKFFTVE